jgi:uncharacterized BrkB/YihY/UPF0761 family membrane protein
VKAYGALGVSLIVLSFLGYVSFNIMLLGFTLVALDTYTSHLFYRDVEQTKNTLLTAVTLLWYDLLNDENNEEHIEEE